MLINPAVFFRSPPPLGRHRWSNNRNRMRVRRLPSNLRLSLGLPVQSPSASTHDISLTPLALLFRELAYPFLLLPTSGRLALS